MLNMKSLSLTIQTLWMAKVKVFFKADRQTGQKLDIALKFHFEDIKARNPR